MKSQPTTYQTRSIDLLLLVSICLVIVAGMIMSAPEEPTKPTIAEQTKQTKLPVAEWTAKLDAEVGKDHGLNAAELRNLATSAESLANEL